MRKQKKQLFQKGLCGILSAAMILTSSMIPDWSVSAAQPDMETVVQGTANDDGSGNSGQED